MEHKPDTLGGGQVTIPRSLIDMRRSFCRNREYDKGRFDRNKKTQPHMPEFSTTRSFPGVGVGPMFGKVSLGVLQS